MKLLLDTHLLLWAAAGILPKKAKELIANEENTLLFSAASVLYIKVSIHI
jgi:PIN domain nuclease of toxin-antitoxin system